MKDPYETLRQNLARAILRSPGELDPGVRTSAAADASLPDAIAAFVHKIHARPHTCADEDVSALRAAGYSEDQLFELIASASLGAATRRAAIALNLLDGGRRATQEG